MYSCHGPEIAFLRINKISHTSHVYSQQSTPGGAIWPRSGFPKIAIRWKNAMGAPPQATALASPLLARSVWVYCDGILVDFSWGGIVPSPFPPLATGLTSASPPDISPTSQLKWPSTYRHPRINLVYLTSQSILILLNESIAMLTGSMFSMDLTKSYVCKWVKVTFTMGYVQNSNIILVLKGSNSSQPIMLLDLGHVIWKWQPESMVQRENIFHI